MIRVWRLAAFGVVVGFAAPAAADDPADRPFVVPGLVIKGTEKGEGTISVSADLLVTGKKDASVSITPTLEVQSSDGVATIFSFGSGGAETNTTWRGGIDVTVRVEQPLDTYTTARNYYQAIITCLREEKLDANFVAELDTLLTVNPAAMLGTAGNASTPVRQRLQAAAESMDIERLCDAGKKIATEGEAIHGQADAKRPLPMRQFSLGFRVGQSTMKYLKPGGLAGTLVLDEDKPWTFRAGVTGIYYYPKPRYTLEWNASFSNDSTPAQEKVRWCVTKDPVDTDPANPADPNSAAETCDERPGAPPTESQTLRGMVAVGQVSREGLARGAIGVIGEISGSEKRTPFKAGFTAPLYFQYANKDYSGLVRVLPSLVWSRDAEGKRGWEAMLSISLLGQRNLFPNALD